LYEKFDDLIFLTVHKKIPKKIKAMKNRKKVIFDISNDLIYDAESDLMEYKIRSWLKSTLKEHKNTYYMAKYKDVID
jgi:hypothetical protein